MKIGTETIIINIDILVGYIVCVFEPMESFKLVTGFR